MTDAMLCARVTADLAKRVKIAAAKNDTTVQAIITDALEAWLKKKP